LDFVYPVVGVTFLARPAYM